MGSRRKAREYTLQALYQVDLRSASPTEIFSTFWIGMEADDSERRFAEAETRGVVNHRQEIDGRIESHSINWKLSRMSYLDRNILRLGVYEMLYAPDIPRTVVINECIELGKRYSTQESGAFINGILDKVAQGLPPEKPRPPSGRAMPPEERDDDEDDEEDDA